VHYRVNEIADVQTEPAVHGGLSRFGRDVVAECNRLGLVVDCAHASFAATMAVLEASDRPVLTSYDQLADLAGVLRERGLPADHVRQILGGNAADLLSRQLGG
jgi:membrane dipeptidase